MIDDITRKAKNIAGHLAGYSGCPNCDDSWYWKKSGSIDYCDGRGVMICEECLALPRLDSPRIVNALRGYGWERHTVAQVVEALLKRELPEAPTKK